MYLHIDFYTRKCPLISRAFLDACIELGKFSSKMTVVWSILGRSDPKKTAIFILVTFFDWYEIQFDQVWSILINSDQLWTDMIQKNPKQPLLSFL